MAKFLKMKDAFGAKDNFEFNPLTMQGIEKFSIYAVNEKKFFNVGDELTIDGITKNVEEWQFTRGFPSEEQRLKYTRTSKVERVIIFEGNEYIIAFPISMNTALLGAMDIVEKMNNNPLNFSYIVTRIKTGPNPMNVEYQVTVGHNTSKASTDINLELSTDDLILTAREQKVLESIRTRIPDYKTRESSVLANLLLKNVEGLQTSRAEFIVKSYLR